MTSASVSSESPGVGHGEGLFLRKSSGLVREIGIRQAIAIGAGILGLINIPWVLASYQLGFPNEDFYVAVIAGGLISLVLCLAYAQLVSTFPRSGGDYVTASRVFSPVFGSMVGGALFLVITLFAASTVITLAELLVPFFFTTLGQALHSGALTTFGSSTLTTKTGNLLDALALTAIVIAIALQPFRVGLRAMFLFFATGLLGFFIVLLVTLFESHTGFVHAFNSASGGTAAYGHIQSAAAKDGFHPSLGFAGAIAGVPIGFLIYLGFTFSNYAAGEMKRPVRTYKIATVSVLLSAMILTVIYWAALRHTVGLHFMQSAASLSGSNPTEYAKITSVSQGTGGLTYATLISGSPVLNVIIALTAVLGLMADPLGYVLMASRVSFALSFDRLLPTRIAEVNSRTHTPLYSIGLIGILVILFVILFIEQALAVIFGILLLLITAIFVFSSAAAMVLPYRRKQLYEASPKAFQGKIFGLPVISVVGFLSMIGCLFMEIELITHTAYTGGYGWKSVVALVICATFGIVLYTISVLRLRNQGIDVKLAMQELPPE